MHFTDLVFDLYGTLVDIHTEENDLVWEKTALYFSYYGAYYTGAELKTDYTSAMTDRESVLGQSYEMFPDVPIEGVFAALFRAKGIHVNADVLALNAAQLFRVTATDYIRVYSGVFEALDMLRKQGFRLWLLSNAQRSFTACELRHLGLEHQFDGVYLSSDYQCRKPDRRFFQALLDEHQLDPQRCLMIGNDRETDIAGAKSVGMATLYMHTNLTPGHQASAASGREPGAAEACRHFEVEGADWAKISSMICRI